MSTDTSAPAMAIAGDIHPVSGTAQLLVTLQMGVTFVVVFFFLGVAFSRLHDSGGTHGPARGKQGCKNGCSGPLSDEEHQVGPDVSPS